MIALKDFNINVQNFTKDLILEKELREGSNKEKDVVALMDGVNATFQILMSDSWIELPEVNYEIEGEEVVLGREPKDSVVLSVAEQI